MTPTQLKNRTARTYDRSSKWISKIDRLAIYLRDEFTCQYCGTNLHGCRPFDITLDHLDPRSETSCPKERRNPARLVTACRSCNSSRQDKPWTEYATGGAVIRIRATIRRSMTKYRKMAAALIADRTGDSTLENR